MLTTLLSQEVMMQWQLVWPPLYKFYNDSMKRSIVELKASEIWLINWAFERSIIYGNNILRQNKHIG